MRVLIVEDNVVIAQLIRSNLKNIYKMDICLTGEEAIINAQAVDYDAIILDLNLPDITGEEVCKELRKKKINTPLIILSGKGEVKDKIDLLNMGADDYITKPFNIYELSARIQVAMRHKVNNSPSGELIVQELKLNPATRQVKRGKVEIKLRRKEFDLLEYLMRNEGQSLTRSMILDHVWESDENLWGNVVDVHIKHLRDRVDKPFEKKLITTVHGIGYKIQADSYASQIKVVGKN